jgi:LCP family protein required for cell wall assembly
MSEHRHVALRDRAVKDRRVAPPETGRRAARRSQAADAPPYEEEPDDWGDDPPKGRRRAGGNGGGGRLRVLGWISIALTGVLVLGTLMAYKVYRDTLGNIARQNIDAALGKNRPVNATGALNVLLVGSDTRAGDANKKYGQHMENAGERTDTIIMMHISPTRDKALLISFPRDSMVQQPECVSPTTKARIPPRLEMINAAFNDGGIVCTIKTIEALTRIRVDHYIKVDFSGFKNIVNALGGIRICLPQAVSDKQAKLTLPAGWQTVKGEAALGYVRMRHGLGDGSDIGRIKRQQVFLSQVVKKATSSDLITSPAKLLGFVTAAAQSVEMDSNLAVGTLIQIAQSARKLTSSGVKFITVPWQAYTADKNRVQWKEPDADNLFNAIRSDVDLPSATPTAKPSTGASAGTTASKPAIKASQVQIQVLNGTNLAGKAKEVAQALADQGFKVTEVGNALPPGGADQPKTRLLYSAKASNGADYAAPVAAKLLAKVTPGTGKIKPTGTLTPFTPTVTSSSTAVTTDTTASSPTGPVIQLVIGSDWDGVKTTVKIPDSASVVDSKTNACTT